MFRVAMLLKNGEQIAENFETKDQCDTWILENMEKHEIKKAIIANKENIKERWIENF
jgi:hypothetical protein